MKILCVVDHFGSGGAQRQMTNLACGLKNAGHDVHMYIYHPSQNFFRADVDLVGITVHEVRKGRGFSVKVIWSLMRLLKRGHYDAAISFLSAPNIYLELASIVVPKTKVIVSERSSALAERRGLKEITSRALHVLADAVVANSISHATWLARHSWLSGKVKAIYNGYPLEPERITGEEKAPLLSLLVIGRIGPEKNGIRLVQALDIFHRKHGYVPKVNWAGREDRSGAGVEYFQRLLETLNMYPIVKSNWSWLGERTDISSLIKEHRALVHASIYEGLPNAVCEAFIAGRPVLASNVCDHPLLVQEGIRGYLFDPFDPESIANSIERMANLNDVQWNELAVNARNYAERHLGVRRMVREYESVLTDCFDRA